MQRNVSEENEVLSSPSSPEFLLPAFETSLQLSDSPLLDQEPACTHDQEQHGRAVQSSPRSKLRRFSRSQSAKKLARSASRTDAQAEQEHALLDATDLRKFKKAEQRLTQSVAYLAKKHNTKTSTSFSDLAFVAENDVSESDPTRVATPPSQPTPQPVTTPTSPVTTPSRRSRLVRAFAGSPMNSPDLVPTSPGSPQVTPRTRGGRRWSQALHAIMSPSPSLPRAASPSLASINDIAWAEATNSSPNVSSTEVGRWEMTIAIESTRAAQNQLLKTVRELIAKLDNKTVENVPDMKECVLFLAEFMYCGGRIPDTPSLNDAFDKVYTKAVRLCKSLARLRSKELSLSQFDGRFRQPAILCHCLALPHEAETDVFGLQVPLTKNDTCLPGFLRQFVSDYVRFAAALREYHVQYRLERRAKRRERRMARVDKARALFSTSGQTLQDVTPEQADIAAVSTQELLQHSLKQAITDNIYTIEDIEAFDPRLMLTLPRMALFYGVRQSAFPTTLQEGEACTVPMEVFLPRVCRSLPYQILVDLMRLDESKASRLALRLAGVEGEDIDAETSLKSITCQTVDRRIDALFRTISKEADAGTSNSRDPRANKLMSRALALHLSEGTEDYSMDDDSTISKAYIMLMGLSTS